MRCNFVPCLAAALGMLAPLSAPSRAEEPAVQRTLRILPSEGNPRNGEGDFVSLNDGRLLYIYTHFTGGTDDHAAAHLAARHSKDGGLTWTREDTIIVRNEGKRNVMSVSLLRLKDGRIALFYLRKNSLSDCRPMVRFSADEANTWSEAKYLIPDEQAGYYVLNNDRVVQLESGRLVAPVSRHHTPDGRWTKASRYGTMMCYCSDDGGRSWHRSKTQRDGSPPEGSNGGRVLLQEPGVVALKDGRLMMFCRTESGSQYLSFSRDEAETWTPFKPSNIISPCSPASIERIPGRGDLLLVWNDHRNVSKDIEGKRTPLCVAISRDEGVTWKNSRVLEGNRDGWYCYTAIHFEGDHVLLGHCAGDRRKGKDEAYGLGVTQITRFPLEWLYSD